LAEEFELACICSRNNTSNEPYPVFSFLPVSKLQFINPFVIMKVVRVAKQQNVSHIMFEHPYHAIAGWILKQKGFKIITHAHNIEYRRFKEMRKPFWPLLRLIEEWSFNFSYLVLFKTQNDIDKAIQEFKLKEKKCVLIPYGVDRKTISDKAAVKERLLKQHQLAQNTTILLFNGTLDYLPNAKAAEDIFTYLVPALNKVADFSYIIFITGRNSSPIFSIGENLVSDKIIMAGYVRNVSEYFTAADVYINPVATGGGIQTKTLEALSYNLNVVCWQNMLAGIDVSKTNNKLLAVQPGDWEQFAIKVKEAASTQNNTPNIFFEYYSFKAHIAKLRQRILETF
jgi:polysaccharide biosynthesis protein PslH